MTPKKRSISKGLAPAARKAPVRPPEQAGTTPRAAGTRPDGLRPGSKMATMFDMVTRPEGATEAQICKAIGWTKCRVTLKRTCDRVGAVLNKSERNAAGEIVYRAIVP
jgi:hypothetical protein